MFRKLYRPDAGDTVTVVIDGTPVEAEIGESVAAVMLRTAPFHARATPVSGARRAPYCMMGVCFDCLAVVDGAPSTQTCQTSVRNGMRVERQQGAWRPGP